MVTIEYLIDAANQLYNDEALGYISGRDVKEGILKSAAELSISAGAIAGAMTEERMDYGFRQHRVDDYARYGEPLTADQVATLSASPAPNIAEKMWIALESVGFPDDERTQAEWVADYLAVQGQEGKPPTQAQKLLHPSLIDAGPSNMRIAVAIRLVNKNWASYNSYNLDQYRNLVDGYVKLVRDLMDETSPLAAHLYGLYLKEAENWFKKNENDTYGGQWDQLPQEFRDALLITFVNVGEEKMAEKRQELYIEKGLPYEPQPGMTVAAGMNHLLNAWNIGNALQFGNYGLEVKGVNSFAQDALGSGDLGLACRYALYRLRYVVLPGLDYSLYNQNGELDLYDPDTGKGQMTTAYVEDRALMVNRLTTLGMSKGNEAYQNVYQDEAGNISFYDVAQNITINVSDDAPKYGFGDEKPNTLTGGSKNDHLYGMRGDDSISGNGGNDYLEGGNGQDTLNGGGGNDTFFVMGEDTAYDTFLGGEGDGDKILGSSGNDTIRLHQFDASSSIEIISGGGGTDIIAGTDGSDTIDLSETTLTGIARIEGGAGADIIVGSDAADILYGGSFDIPEDTAQDRLEGGAGNDTYYIGAGDTISDSDNQGTIWFGGRKLPSLTLTQIFENLNYYESADKSYRATLDSDTGTLAIHGTGYGTGVFYLENFAVTSSGLGITLEEYQKPEAEFDHTLLGAGGMQLVDFIYIRGEESVCYYSFKNFWLDSGENEHYEIISNLGKVTITESFEIYGGAGNDRLIGLAGSDLLVGGEGHDVIFGIVSEALPIVSNQKGDTIEGNEGNDILIGSGGDDSISGGGDMDCIVGASGIDTMLGDTESDVLVGGAGNDTANWLKFDGNQIRY